MKIAIDAMGGDNAPHPIVEGVVQAATDRTMINCFLPTTPNPTSGFYLLVPEDEVQAIDISVEDAFKLVMSAGLVAPNGPGETALGAQPAPPSLPTN